MTDWNARYLQDDTPWDKGMAAPPLYECMEKLDPNIWGNGEILVPGCGTGHDVRALAKKQQAVRGLDIAEEAIKRALQHPRIFQENYELGDFLNPEWRAGKNFSAIWEHTCFCAIDPILRNAYAKACAELLAPGACLVGVFFLTPYDSEDEQQGPPFPSSISEIDLLFAPYFQRESAWIPENAYPGRQGREWIAVYRKG